MNLLIAALFLIVGAINLTPVIGVLSTGTLTELYGVDELSGDVALLLRHRAVLFGIVGTLLAAAAFVPNLRLTATIAGLVSMLSYAVLALVQDVQNPKLIQIGWIDIAASVALFVAWALHIHSTDEVSM